MTHPTPAQPRTPDSPTPASAGPYAPGQPMPSDEQITTYLEMESYMARALAHTTDGSSIEERAAIAVRFVRAAVAEPGGNHPESPDSSPAREGFTFPDAAVEALRAKIRRWEDARTVEEGVANAAADISEYSERLRASRVPAQPEGEKASETKMKCPHCKLPAKWTGERWVCSDTNLRGWCQSWYSMTAPPAPQPEAAAVERPKCPRHSNTGTSDDNRSCFCTVTPAPPPPTGETAEPAPDPLEAEDIACIREHRAASRVVLMYDDEYSDTPRRWPWESYMDADPARIAKAREKSTLPNVATRRPRLYVRDDAEWRSVPLVVLPTRVDEQTAPTVTLPLADAQGLLLAIDAWGLVLKPAIVLREAIERAKP